MKRSIYYFCIVFCFTVIGWSCNSKKNNDSGKIRIGILVVEGGIQKYNNIDILENYFSKKLNREVEIIKITNPSVVIEAMRTHKIDVGSGGPLTYLVANKTANAEAIISTALANGNPHYYTSCLITNPKSGIRDIHDLLTHPKDFTLSWAYPTSASGHLVPRYFFQQKGIYPKDFKEVITSSDHVATLLSVASGKVDVAGIMSQQIEYSIGTGKIKSGDVKVLWTSAPMVEGPVFARKDLGKELIKKIQQAYLDMAKEDPKAAELLKNQFRNDLKYIAVDDSYYDGIRKIANEIKGLNLNF